MSKALEIASERYAKGEITKDEFDAITKSLKETEAESVSTPSDSALNLDKLKTESTSLFQNAWKGLQVFGGIIIVILIISYLNAPSSRGLTVGNIEGMASSVRLDIANNSNKSGDILIWIVKDDIRMCDHVIEMRAKWRIRNLSVPCRTGPGRFTVHSIWADGDRDRVSIARRLER